MTSPRSASSVTPRQISMYGKRDHINIGF